MHLVVHALKSLVAAALLVCVAIAPANAGGMMNSNANDPPARFMPGKYFEYKAQFYLKKKDYRAALEMFELAGFWADNIGTYNAGIMYYNGIGVAADRARGTAWLGIAAESHGDLADAMLQQAYGSLSAQERQQAEAIWKELDAKYGDRAAVKRALQRFASETRMATGSRLGFKGDLTVYEYGSNADPLGQTGAGYYADREKERDALIEKLQGRVSVGTVTALPVPGATKAAVPPGEQARQ